MRRSVVPLLIALAGVFATGPASASAAALPADTTAIVSGLPDLVTALASPAAFSGAGPHSVSADGRTVVFLSDSDGLVDGDDDDVTNVYAKDMVTGAVRLVSRASGVGGAVAHRGCGDTFGDGDGAPAISADGRRVAFVCTDPLDAADDNDAADVYVRDLVNDITLLVSRASGDGGRVGNRDSVSPALDATGQQVVFASTATNLGGAQLGENPQIYRRFVFGTQETVRISPATRPDGTAIRRGFFGPSVSAGGTRIAFATAERLVADDVNDGSDVYVADIAAGTLTLASRASGASGAPGDGRSTDALISADGKAVAFTSESDNLAPADRDDDPDVFRRSLTPGDERTILVSRSVSGPAADGASTVAGIDATGDHIAFTSTATNLDPLDPSPAPDAYISLGGGATLVASRPDGFESTPFQDSTAVALSEDGQHVVFDAPPGASPDAVANGPILTLRDVLNSTTRTVARPAGDARFADAGGESTEGSVSADGRYVAFLSQAPALFGAVPQRTGLFVRDTQTGGVARADLADGAAGAPLDGRILTPRLSGDGSRVAFVLDPPGPDDERIVVRDLRTQTTIVADRADGPDGVVANHASAFPSISADGSRVAFGSPATNLGGPPGRFQVYVRDLAAGRTLLVSRADGAAGAPGDRGADEPSISSDGRHVVFISASTNLGDGDTDSVMDVHVRDLETSRTELISLAGDRKADQASQEPSIDGDGGRVAFSSGAAGFDGAVPGEPHVYVRDRATRALLVAGRGDGPASTPVRASDPVISADGSTVAFNASARGGFAPGLPDTNRLHGFVRVLAANTTRLVTRASGTDGAPAAGRRDGGVTGLTADGGCAVFTAPGSLAPGGSPDYRQVFLRVLKPDCGRPTPRGPGGAPGGNPGGTPPAPPSPDLVRPVVRPDRAAPRLTAARFSRTRFRPAARGKGVSVHRAIGASLTLRTSEAARLTITVERERPGRRSRSTKPVCRVVKVRPRRDGCTAYRHDGTILKTLKQGGVRIAFTGRLGNKALAPGRHRLRLVAVDRAGNASRAVTLRFTMLRATRP